MLGISLAITVFANRVFCTMIRHKPKRPNCAGHFPRFGQRGGCPSRNGTVSVFMWESGK